MYRISKKLFRLILKKNLKISFAESMTGGFLAYNFILNPGASNFINYSIIAYSNDIKVKELNVSVDSILNEGVVSKKVAEEMALGLKQKTNSDICVSITGKAGPYSQEDAEEKEKLTAYFTVLVKDFHFTFLINFKNDKREKNIKKAFKKVYKKTYKLIRKR